MATLEEIQKQIDETTDEKSKVDLLNRLSFEGRNVDPAASAEVAEKALALSEKINYESGKANALLHLGFCFMQMAAHEKAFGVLMDCISVFEKTGNESGIAHANYNLGILNIRVGNFNEGIEVLNKSLAWREKNNDLDGMAACYFQIAYINVHFNDYEDAKSAAEKSLALREQLNDAPGISAALMVLGDVYLRQKDFEKAKEALSRSLYLRENSAEKLGYYATLIRWTELHIELGELEKAKMMAEVAHEKTIHEGIPYGVMRFVQLMGKVNLALGNLKEAKNNYLEAMQYADQLSFKSVAYELHETVGNLFEREGDYKSALEHFRKFHQLKEEVITMNSNAKLKSVQYMNQIEFARKEAEIEKNKNAELQKAYQIIEEKNKDITASITYAKRIQFSLLPSEKYIEKNLKRLSE